MRFSSIELVSKKQSTFIIQKTLSTFQTPLLSNFETKQIYKPPMFTFADESNSVIVLLLSKRENSAPSRRRRQHIENRTSLTKLGEQYQLDGADEAKQRQRTGCRHSRRRTNSPHQDDVFLLFSLPCLVHRRLSSQFITVGTHGCWRKVFLYVILLHIQGNRPA